MITENDILGFVPYPPSWTTEQVAKRGVYLLAKVVTLLFLACLAGPKAYMCSKDGNKDGRLDVQERLVELVAQVLQRLRRGVGGVHGHAMARRVDVVAGSSRDGSQ